MIANEKDVQVRGVTAAEEKAATKPKVMSSLKLGSTSMLRSSCSSTPNTPQ